MKKSIAQIMNGYGAPKCLILLEREDLVKPYMARYGLIKMILKEEGIIPFDTRSEKNKRLLNKYNDFNAQVTDIIWSNRKLMFDV